MRRRHRIASQAIYKRLRKILQNHSVTRSRKVKIMKLVFLTMIFFAMTQGRVFLHPKDATNESFQKESLQKEPETEEFEKRLRIHSRIEHDLSLILYQMI